MKQDIAEIAHALRFAKFSIDRIPQLSFRNATEREYDQRMRDALTSLHEVVAHLLAHSHPEKQA